MQVLYVNSVETLTNHPTTPLTNHNNPLLHKSGKAGSWTLPLSRFRGQAPAVRACHSGNWQSSAGPHTLRRTAPNGASHGQTWLEEDTTSKTWFTGDPVPACFSFFFQSVSARSRRNSSNSELLDQTVELVLPKTSQPAAGSGARSRRHRMERGPEQPGVGWLTSRCRSSTNPFSSGEVIFLKKTMRNKLIDPQLIEKQQTVTRP